MKTIIIFKGDFTDLVDYNELKKSLSGCYIIKHEGEENENLQIQCKILNSKKGEDF